jgi:hypothetical protein
MPDCQKPEGSSRINSNCLTVLLDIAYSVEIRQPNVSNAYSPTWPNPSGALANITQY